MGTKNNPGKFDCTAAALPDEPMFTLLARDPSAPDLVDEWAVRRLADIMSGERPEEDMPKVREAHRCAANMRSWRNQNEGKWRK